MLPPKTCLQSSPWLTGAEYDLAILAEPPPLPVTSLKRAREESERKSPPFMSFRECYHLPRLDKTIRCIFLSFVSDKNRKKLAEDRHKYLIKNELRVEKLFSSYNTAKKTIRWIRKWQTDEVFSKKIIICPMRDGIVGLRAHEEFKKGEIVGVIGGEVVPLATATNIPYLMETSYPGWVIDWEKNRTFAAMIRDVPPSATANAVTFIYNGEEVPQIVVITTREIHRGEDIFLQPPL